MYYSSDLSSIGQPYPFPRNSIKILKELQTSAWYSNRLRWAIMLAWSCKIKFQAIAPLRSPTYWSLFPLQLYFYYFSFFLSSINRDNWLHTNFYYQNTIFDYIINSYVCHFKSTYVYVFHVFLYTYITKFSYSSSFSFIHL